MSNQRLSSKLCLAPWVFSMVNFENKFIVQGECDIAWSKWPFSLFFLGILEYLPFAKEQGEADILKGCRLFPKRQQGEWGNASIKLSKTCFKQTCSVLTDSESTGALEKSLPRTPASSSKPRGSSQEPGAISALFLLSNLFWNSPSLYSTGFYYLSHGNELCLFLGTWMCLLMLTLSWWFLSIWSKFIFRVSVRCSKCLTSNPRVNGQLPGWCWADCFESISVSPTIKVETDWFLKSQKGKHRGHQLGHCIFLANI